MPKDEVEWEGEPLVDLARMLENYERAGVMAPALSLSQANAFEMRFIRLSRIVVRKECVFPKHLHRSCELFMPQKGLYKCEVNGKRLSVRPG